MLNWPASEPNNALNRIGNIGESARGNRFEELKKLEESLAAFGEDALPEIEKTLLAGKHPHLGPPCLRRDAERRGRQVPEGEEIEHPRAKLVLLGAASRMESERARLLLAEFANTQGPAQEAWLRMTARDMLMEKKRPNSKSVPLN